MDIISLPFEIDRKIIDSKYRLVIVASQRTRDLIMGRKPKIFKKYSKDTSTAIAEVLEGKVDFLTGEAARIAQKEYKKMREEKIKEKAKRPFLNKEEVAEEIKRELSNYVDDSNKDVEEPSNKDGEVL